MSSSNATYDITVVRPGKLRVVLHADELDSHKVKSKLSDLDPVSWVLRKIELRPPANFVRYCTVTHDRTQSDEEVSKQVSAELHSLLLAEYGVVASD